MNNKKHILSPDARRRIYLNYLTENKGASTSDFIKYLKVNYNVDVSRATLCEDRKFLKDIGFEFSKPKKSTTKYIVKTNPDNMKTSRITSDLVMSWMILGLAEKAQKQFSKNNFLLFNENDELLIPERKIPSYLKQLAENSYLTSAGNYIYSLHPSASSIYNVSDKNLKNFYETYQKVPVSGATGAVIEPFYQFCNLLLNEDSKSPDTFSRHFQHGRQNPAPEKLNQQLNRLSAFPYQTYQLNLAYSSPRLTEKQYFLFSVAFIFYNIETDQCYLLGKSDQNELMLCRLDRIDFDATTSSKHYNYIYKSPQIRRIYNEMFSASLDDPQEVKICFELFSDNIHTKIMDLHNHRSTTSHIEYSEDYKYIFYTDTIRDISSFAHYLRSFGSAARVISPPVLKDMMLSSAKNVLKNYIDHPTP